MTERIVATVTAAEQVSSDTWQDRHMSRVFSSERPVANILGWARRELNDPTIKISRITFSEYTGESS